MTGVVGNIPPKVTPLPWLERDVRDAMSIALVLDLIDAKGAAILSEQVRDSAVDLLRGDWPSLLHAWRFCHAARLCQRDGDTRTAATARRLGCMIANAVLKGWTVVDVIFVEVGSSASYVALDATRAAEERNGVMQRVIFFSEEALFDRNPVPRP